MWDFYIGYNFSFFYCNKKKSKVLFKIKKMILVIFFACKRIRSKSPFQFYNMWFSPPDFYSFFYSRIYAFSWPSFREDSVKVELSRAFKGHLIIKVVLRILPLSRRKLIVCTSQMVWMSSKMALVLLPRLNFLSNPIIIINKVCLLLLLTLCF